MFDTLFTNGTVVTHEGHFVADIGVKDGVIVAIGQQLGEALVTVNAKGKFIFPGNIDVHVHFNEPGNAKWEGFETGSRLLAAGGVTSYLDMPLNANPPTISVQALREKQELASQKSIVEPFFWGGLVHNNVDELEGLANEGVIGFKAFLSNSGFTPFQAVQNDSLLQGMYEIARLGKILAVHAESEELTSFLQKRAVEQGRTTALDYAHSRPIVAELEAVHRVLYYAKLTECAVHFVHISSAVAVEAINNAKREGLNVSVETCPHYLLFNEETLQRGVLAKCAPPLREEQERLRLIDCLLNGQIDIVASDHSPCPPEMKDLTGKTFFDVWGGINGGQFTFQALLTICHQYNVPFSNVVKWFSYNPAQRFQLARKGQIAVGFDADIVVVEKQFYVVERAHHLAKHKPTIYEGEVFNYTVDATYQKGRLVYEHAMQNA